MAVCRPSIPLGKLKSASTRSGLILPLITSSSASTPSRRRDDAMTRAPEHGREQVEHFRVVFNNEDFSGDRNAHLRDSIRGGRANFGPWRRFFRLQCDLDRETPSLRQGRERTRAPGGPSVCPIAARWKGRDRDRGPAPAPRCRADGVPRRSPAVLPLGCRCRYPRFQYSAYPLRHAGKRVSTLPSLVYFKAFDSRLRSICSSRPGSLRIDSPHCGPCATPGPPAEHDKRTHRATGRANRRAGN